MSLPVAEGLLTAGHNAAFFMADQPRHQGKDQQDPMGAVTTSTEAQHLCIPRLMRHRRNKAGAATRGRIGQQITGR